MNYLSKAAALISIELCFWADCRFMRQRTNRTKA